MARTRRRYGAEDPRLDADRAEGVPCRECGCRHSFVIRTERLGDVVRRTRMCRFCGARFVTTES